MNPAAWTRIKDCLGVALELGPEARETYLSRLEPAVRTEVEALLRAPEATTGVLASPVSRGTLADAFEAVGPSGDPLVGADVGPYRVERRVGRGGMGDVYRAHRADGLFDRTVALKVVRRGADTEAVLRRFAAERRILGGLQHPGIAALLGAGTVDDGRPWIAMEFVEGTPLNEAVAELDLEAIVALMADVAEAVHAAHRNLVVHRDLKPSNVLVSRDAEGRPRAKLLDFGIAKLLDPDAEADLTVADGHRPMTRAYAAPEQVTGADITTATDVYALGVLTYEALAGRRPVPRDLSREAHERAIVEADPRPPSARTSDPARARRLRGDLDLICLKALRKEPGERYASAEAFAADLRRFLDRVPVRARPPSAAYRVRRFVARHRVGVAAAAAALVSVVALSGLYAGRLAAERDRARTEAATASEVADLLVELFDRDPMAGDAERLDTLSVGAFIVQRGDSALAQLATQPRVQARLATLLSKLHSGRGDYDRALEFALTAVALTDSLGLDADPDRGDAMTALGTAHAQLGAYDEALARHLDSYRIRRAVHGPRHVSVAEAANNLGVVYYDIEDGIGPGKRYGAEALETYRALLGDGALETAQAHNNLGTLYYAEGDNETAAEHYREALRIRRERLGGHPLVANTLNNLANLEHELGDTDRASALFVEAIRIWKTTLGEAHPTVSAGLFGLSEVLRDQGRPEQAEAVLVESIAIDRASLPAGHPYIADGVAMLARLQMAQREWAPAREHLREAIAIYTAREDRDEPAIAAAQADLGRVLLQLGDRAAAVAPLRAAIAGLEDADRRAAAEADLRAAAR